MLHRSVAGWQRITGTEFVGHQIVLVTGLRQIDLGLAVDCALVKQTRGAEQEVLLEVCHVEIGFPTGNVGAIASMSADGALVTALAPK